MSKMAATAAILKIYINFFWTERTVNLKLDRKYQGNLQIKNS